MTDAAGEGDASSPSPSLDDTEPVLHSPLTASMLYGFDSPALPMMPSLILLKAVTRSYCPIAGVNWTRVGTQ